MNMRVLWQLTVVAVTSLALATCALFHTPDALIFSHKYHLSEEEMECSDCHRHVDKATSLDTSLIPTEKLCLTCHSRKKKDCGFCHTNAANPGAQAFFRSRSLRFDHQGHLGRILKDAATPPPEPGGPCNTCHASVITADTVAASEPTEMLGTCMSCHKADFREVRCDTCHTDLVASVDRPMDFVAHRGDFLERHSGVARGEDAVCGHCHSQSSCAECHSRMAPGRPALLQSDAVDRAFVHRGDFLTNHGIQARLQPDRCLTCHQQARCNGCHTERGIGATGQGSLLGPHPLAWMQPGAPGSHGAAARRNISACASCHDRGRSTNCVTCHKVGASGGSPHPNGWSSRISPGTGRACVWCHN